MKNLSFLLVFILTAGCTAPSKFPDRIPSPIQSESLIYLMADQEDYEKYLGTTSDADNATQSESKGYHYFNEKLTQDAYALAGILSKHLYVSNRFPLCYNPSHYVGYLSASGQVQLEICFDCGRAKVSVNGWEKWFLVSPEAEPEISAILAERGILHPKYPASQQYGKEH